MKKQVWLVKAVVLGLSFFLAIFMVKPIGVSTEYSVVGGMIQSLWEPELITENENDPGHYVSTNAYYNKDHGAIATAIKTPLQYNFIFVLSIPLGSFIGYVLLGGKKKSRMTNVGEDPNRPDYRQGFIRRYLPSFLGGFLLLFGARMAGGCTSGHMMSGIMQGSVSGFVFAITVFLVAIPTAIIMGTFAHRKGDIS